MTACVNRKHTKKVAAVVTASLVGALSLGVAPVAAVADTGIDMQAAAWNTGAKVTKATDGKGATISNPNQPTLTPGKYLKPSEVTNSFGDVTKIDDDYTLKYVQVISGVETSFSESSFATFTGSGTFGVYVVKTGATGAEAQAGPFYFKIGTASQTLENVHAYVGDDPSSTEIYWNDAELKGDIKFATADGTELDGATATWTDTNGAPVTSVKGPGTYVAKVTYQGATTNVTVKVSALDLSKVSVSHKDMKLAAGATVVNPLDGDLVVNGNKYSTSSYLKVTSVTKSDGSAGFNGSGQYTVTVASAGTVGTTDYDNFVKGSASFTLNVIDVDLFTDKGFDINYGRDPMPPTKTIYLSDGESLDLSKITVTDGTDTYSGDQLEITFEKGGKAVDASELSNPGKYTMTVRVKPVRGFVDGKLVGGSDTRDIDVKGESASWDSNLAFYFDGKIAGNSATAEFDGSDFLEDIEAVVKVGDKTYEEGTDFTLEVRNGKNELVDEIVDVDTYKITVKPITFDLTGTSVNGDTLTFAVTQVTADQLVADVDSMKIDANETTGEIVNALPVYDEDGNVIGSNTNEFYVAYTGSAVEVPGVLYGVEDTTSTPSKWTYKELSSDLYNVVSIKNDKTGKTVDEAVEEGTYTVEIALNDTAGGNYNLGGHDTFKFTIKKFGHFTDVDATKWYSVAVEQAYSQWYINGISNTNLFAPEAEITRADAVCILFNMAGGDNISADFSYSEMTGYNTGFNDVDGHAYFAKALAWAKAFGVANGSNGNFRPYDQITREEFASLLANYAKAMGKFEAADASALDGVSDANTVSDWAKDNVAWAVENGVMGNGGFVAGQSNIIRAEVAAMAVNYQPEMIRDDVDPR